MVRHRASQAGLTNILKDPSVRKVDHQGQVFFAVIDVLNELMLEGEGLSAWMEIKARRPELATASERLHLPDGDVTDCLDLRGVLRLVQSVSGQRAERIRWWLAEAGQQQLAEATDPEVTLRRARQAYEDQGHDRKWVARRLTGISQRQELTAEWYRRGARASEDYRELTRGLMEATFGADLPAQRVAHGLAEDDHTNLRDRMGDLELALTALAETAAVALHRDRASRTMEDLRRDVADAGAIAGRAREGLEVAMGHAIAAVSRENASEKHLSEAHAN